MDLLHQRYASPFSFLDTLLINSQFNEFVQFILNRVAEEKNDTKLWEFFLHKVYDKSFEEFKTGLSGQAGANDVMDEAKKEEIIARSNAILNGFNPHKEGGEEI